MRHGKTFFGLFKNFLPKPFFVQYDVCNNRIQGSMIACVNVFILDSFWLMKCDKNYKALFFKVTLLVFQYTKQWWKEKTENSSQNNGIHVTFWEISGCLITYWFLQNTHPIILKKMHVIQQKKKNVNERKTKLPVP